MSVHSCTLIYLGKTFKAAQFEKLNTIISPNPIKWDRGIIAKLNSHKKKFPLALTHSLSQRMELVALQLSLQKARPSSCTQLSSSAMLLPTVARQMLQMHGTVTQCSNWRSLYSTSSFLISSHSRGWETNVGHLNSPACRSSVGDVAALPIKSITLAASAQAYHYFNHIRSLRLSCKSGLMQVQTKGFWKELQGNSWRLTGCPKMSVYPPLLLFVAHLAHLKFTIRTSKPGPISR